MSNPTTTKKLEKAGDKLFAALQATENGPPCPVELPFYVRRCRSMKTGDKVAQSMARHSDVNLTMGIYSHVEVAQQAEAIKSLPTPPAIAPTSEAIKSRTVRTDDPTEEIVAPIVAPAGDFASLCEAVADYNCPSDGEEGSVQNPLPEKELVILCQALTSDDPQLSQTRCRRQD